MRRRARPSPTAFFLVLAIGAVAAATLLLRLWLGWSWLVDGLLSLSGVTFLLYGYDKFAARVGRLRVPERVLQGLALLGGSPGALLGQRVFSHKTAKPGFQALFWVICGVQLVLLALWWTGRL